jgi:hypothetical protein
MDTFDNLVLKFAAVSLNHHFLILMYSAIFHFQANPTYLFLNQAWNRFGCIRKSDTKWDGI